MESLDHDIVLTLARDSRECTLQCRSCGLSYDGYQAFRRDTEGDTDICLAWTPYYQM